MLKGQFVSSIPGPKVVASRIALSNESDIIPSLAAAKSKADRLFDLAATDD
jgi:hypothetical protein